MGEKRVFRSSPIFQWGTKEECTFYSLRILFSPEVLNFSPRATIFLKLQFGLVFEIAGFHHRKDLFEIDSPTRPSSLVGVYQNIVWSTLAEVLP